MKLEQIISLVVMLIATGIIQPYFKTLFERKLNTKASSSNKPKITFKIVILFLLMHILPLFNLIFLLSTYKNIDKYFIIMLVLNIVLIFFIILLDIFFYINNLIINFLKSIIINIEGITKIIKEVTTKFDKDSIPSNQETITLNKEEIEM